MNNENEEQLIKILKEEAGDDLLTHISGTVINPGKISCCIGEFKHNGTIGSVYGFVIRLSKKEKINFLKSLENQTKITPLPSEEAKNGQAFSLKKNIDLTKWNPISKTSNLYPLYWGCSKWLGYRVVEHTKSNIKVGSIWLFGIDALRDKEVYFATIECNNYTDHEKSLHREHNDILKNFSNK